MALKRKTVRAANDLGRKVSAWLADNRADGSEPSTNLALARALGVTHTAVAKWIRGSTPRYPVVLRLAQIMGVRPEDLMNDSRPIPSRQAAQQFDALLRMIPDDEKLRLIPIMRDPVERRALIAYWLARMGARSE